MAVSGLCLADDRLGIGKILRIAQGGIFDSGELIIDLIPSFPVHNAGFRQFKSSLSSQYRISGLLAEDAVDG
jgi:hypothetical protein